MTRWFWNSSLNCLRHTYYNRFSEKVFVTKTLTKLLSALATSKCPNPNFHKIPYFLPKRSQLFFFRTVSCSPGTIDNISQKFGFKTTNRKYKRQVFHNQKGGVWSRMFYRAPLCFNSDCVMWCFTLQFIVVQSFFINNCSQEKHCLCLEWKLLVWLQA